MAASSRKNRLVDIMIAVAVIAIAIYLYLSSSNTLETSNEPLSHSDNVSVVSGKMQLSDGDSLYSKGKKIRLIGIDAPELHQSCEKNGRSYPCGELAKKHLADLIDGHEISCTWAKKDKFDRLLGQCLANGHELNRQMVEDGWAVSYYDYPQEEADARNKKLGIWAGTFDWPRLWRRAHPR
ncbi:thermonuclease family protein [uncultured Bartonella sp.]|uniref:thermonuclease family protein n=1 Tax=uncultured Bartonella sp. TaxID=104108 RepID=UPI00262F033F|nr:thermonuclease family protein [uncultured Bartonella sp.]